VLIVLPTLSLGAQRPTTLAERMCEGCAITFERLFDLAGSAAGDLPPGTPIVGLRMPTGELLVVYGEQPWQIVRHGPDGVVRARSGAQGDGPGEFRSITRLKAAPGGGALAIDEGRRLAVLLSSDMNETRRVQLPLVPFDAMMTTRGAIVLAGTQNSREAVGYPIHVLDAAGQVTRSFGSDDPVFRPDMRTALTRLLAPGKDGSIWAAHRNQYQVERWSEDGRSSRTLRREVSWFRPWLRAAAGVRQPLVVDVAERPDGLLVVLLRVPGDSTQSGERERMGRMYDSVVEIIDPGRGAVIAHARSDPVLAKLLDADHAVQPYALDDLESRAAVWRIVFTQTGGSRQ
jgi:hypothetical protein